MQINFLFIQNDIARRTTTTNFMLLLLPSGFLYGNLHDPLSPYSIYKTMNKLCRMKMQLKLSEMYIHIFRCLFPSLKSHFQLYSHNKIYI